MDKAWIIVALAGVLSSPTAIAQLRAPNCKDLQQAAEVNSSFEARLAERQSEIQSHTAERLHRIDDTAKQLIASGVWTANDRQQFFAKVRASTEYTWLEKQKTEPLLAVQLGRSTAIGIRSSNPPGACSYALSTIDALDKVQSLVDRQYDLFEGGMAALKPATQ